MKSALIIGGDSTIGSALANHLTARGVTVTTTSRRPGSKLLLDLSHDPERWPELPETDVTYLCAAIAKLEICESNPDKTYFINVTRMQQLAARLISSHLVFLSSNQVFSGLRAYCKTTDIPDPMNKYGKQKATFEDWLLSQENPASVLRLTKVISGALPIFSQWEKTLRNNEIVHAFDDLIFAPLPLDNAVEALAQIGEKKIAGISHLSGTRDVSYFELAKMLAAKMGAKDRLVKPASAKHKGILPQFLPKHGTLESSALPELVVPAPEQFII